MFSRVLAGALPRSGPTRTLALAAGVDSLGSGFFQAGGVIYFVTLGGLDPALIGVTISVANICGLLSPVPIGMLVDRIGVYKIYQAMLVLRGIGYAAYPFATNVGAYVVLTCLLTALERACSPQMQIIVGEVEAPQERTRTMASIRTMRNAGLTLGLLLGGSVIAFDTRTAFVALFAANSVSFVLVAVALQLIFVRVRALAAARAEPEEQETTPRPEPGAAPEAEAPVLPARKIYRDTRFLLVCAANTVLSLHDSVLFVLLPIWVVQSAQIPASMSSVLLAINTALTVVLQIYISRFGRGTRAAMRLIRWAAVLLAGSCVLFLAAEHRTPAIAVVFAVVAVVVLSVGENLHSVGSWELSYELSPPKARSQYLSLFSTTLTVQMILGPIIMTALILRSGLVGWLVLGGLFMLSAWLTSAAVRPTLPPRESAETGAVRPA